MKSIILSQWKFHYGDIPDAWYKGYSDHDWDDVTVPHDWSVHMPFSREYSSGTGYLAGGTGWYRTSFYLPEDLRGKRIYVTADGIYKNSRIWCNSYFLGKRPYGYSTFRYDITEQVQFGDIPNILSVCVQHEDISDSRWFTGSGIIRKITIDIEEAVHPSFRGIFFKTPCVNVEKAEIEIDNSITNDSPEEVSVTVKNRLIRNNSEILSIQSSSIIMPGATALLTNHGQLMKPALWSPESPQLYRLVTIITAISDNGSIRYQMETSQMVGIRDVYFDPDKGFFLNAIPYKIKGVCVHHDAGCLGAAVLPEVWLRRLLTLKEMGCNAIRMSHNPHMPELYDLCDRLGFFVMDEAFDEWEGPKNKWSTGHNVYPPKHQGYYEDFHNWHKDDLKDLIIRDRNHPSVIAWSIGNEIDYPNDPYCHPSFQEMVGNNDKNKPAQERIYNQDRPNAERLSVIAKSLVSIVKQYDNTRPVTAAAAFPELSSKIGFLDSYDILCYNYKEHLYQEDHLRFPGKTILGSENNHSYKAWKVVRDCEYVSGQFLWTGIDFLGEAQGWPIHGSGAGLLTLAGFPKTSFYRRKSFWSDEPVLYLVTARAEDTNHKASENTEWKPMFRNWNYNKGELIEVRCYTNLPYVKLYMNNSFVNIQSKDDNTEYLSWVLPYEPGTLYAEGYQNETTTNCIITDSIAATGSSCNIQLMQWHAPNETEDSDLYKDILELTSKADISRPYLKQIEVTITDSAGHIVTNDSSMLFVTVTGSGKLAGLENGDLSDNTEYSAPYRRAFEGRLLIYIMDDVRMNETIVTVHGNGLKSASITC